MSGAQYVPGSDADFDRLYRDSYGRLLTTLRAMLPTSADAEDCAQETFVSAYRAWAGWRPDAPAEAWLHRIAVNVAISHRRRERLRDPLALLQRLGRQDPPPDPADDGEADLLPALRRLPPEQSALIVLRYLHGYSNRELAAATGSPESTVASRLAAARARLASDLSVGSDEHALRGIPRRSLPIGAGDAP